MSSHTFEIRTEVARVGLRDWYRLSSNGVVSPLFRSREAADLFRLDGSFQQLLQGITAVTQLATTRANKINAMGDKQLESRLDSLRPSQNSDR